ncbi:tRNA (34-2'-O)-methyltransferase regulator WDR6 [Amia ocellicauda]|uniref:tRNA (34-2'-O)-methyltransferase regulator WDR6 n=1 Tax=Amia ocellicauda TaxID=2972642 RepID=UPI0034644220
MESPALIAPVTALEFLGEEYLLSGEGPILSAFSLKTASLAPSVPYAKLSVLRNHRIHGIRPAPWPRARRAGEAEWEPGDARAGQVSPPAPPQEERLGRVTKPELGQGDPEHTQGSGPQGEGAGRGGVLLAVFGGKAVSVVELSEGRSAGGGGGKMESIGRVCEEEGGSRLSGAGGEAEMCKRGNGRDGARLAELCPLWELQDWVWEACWLEDSRYLAVVLAHNAAVLLDPWAQVVLAQAQCQEGCLLYSALLTGPSWAGLVLVGGTVFNQVVLWRPGGGGGGGEGERCGEGGSRREEAGPCQVERRLRGHGGVIFGLAHGGVGGRWLASASDDRSVRLWGVGALGGAAGCGVEEAPCLRVLYGHQARVFTVRLTPTGRLVSAGEDSLCLLWDGRRGKVARRLKGHRTGGVRALAVSGGGWVATGGADGGIWLWRIGGEGEGEGEEEEMGTKCDLRFQGRGAPKIVRLVQGGAGAEPQVVVLTDEGGLYLHTGEAVGGWQQLGGAQEDRDFQSYSVMELSEGEADGGEGVLCAVGSLGGKVRVFPLFQPGGTVELRAGCGKIHSLHWARQTGRDTGRGRWQLFASGAEGLVYRWEVCVMEGEGEDDREREQAGDEEREREGGRRDGWREGQIDGEGEGEGQLSVAPLCPFLLPLCAKRWLTTVEPLQGALWACGDRRGSVLLYRDRREGERERREKEDAKWLVEREVLGEVKGKREQLGQGGVEKDRLKERDGEGEGEGDGDGNSALGPVSVLFGLHGKQGVTSLSCRGELLYSTGRDGCIRALGLWRGGVRDEREGREEALEVLRAQRACRGMDWVERVLFLEEEEEEELTEGEKEWREMDGLGVGGGERVSVQGSRRSNRGGGGAEALLERGREEGGGESRAVGQGGGRFLVMGFQSVDFVVWDPVRLERLLSVRCGGGHRSWGHCRPPRTDGRDLSFVFVKQGAVFLSRGRGRGGFERPRELKAGLHGRGVGCVCRLGRVGGGGGGPGWEVLVTGGEDTALSVLGLRPLCGTVTVLAVITDHLSSVRALATVPERAREGGGDRQTDGLTDGQMVSPAASCFSTLLFSAGGRAQLQCYQLLIGLDRRKGTPSCQVIQVAGHRLAEQWERRRNRHKTVKMDPETRYMSLAVVYAGTGVGQAVLLAAGCSDGAVRLFSLGLSPRRLDLVWESFHHQRCVLSVAPYSHCSALGSRRQFLCSAATDGRIAVWDLTEVVVGGSWLSASPRCQGLLPSLCVRAHQSGVNSLAVWEVGGRLQLASGGDDGSLTVSTIGVQYPPGDTEGAHSHSAVSLTLDGQTSVPCAHAAPLTALQLLTPDLLATTSADQRLLLWGLGGGGGVAGALRWGAGQLCHVADAASLEVWGEGEGEGGRWLAVCGQGLQLLRVPLCELDRLQREVGGAVRSQFCRGSGCTD